MAVNLKRFGHLLRELRVSSGEKMMPFAVRSGIPRSNLYKLEAGEANPGALTLRRLAKAHGVTVASLLEEQEGPSRPPQKAPDRTPASLAGFIEEWESEHRSRLPRDVVRSLAGLQFHGKRPRTREDWRVIHAFLARMLKG